MAEQILKSLVIYLMTRKEVCKALSVSSATLHRGILSGKFPAAYRTGENSVRWKSTEIQAYLEGLQHAEPVRQIIPAEGKRRGRPSKKQEVSCHE